jgi:hypothetical protein
MKAYRGSRSTAPHLLNLALDGGQSALLNNHYLNGQIKDELVKAFCTHGQKAKYNILV